MSLDQEFAKLAEAVALEVFSPAYNDGPWYVYFRGSRHLCRNKVTADAWAKYLMRRYGSWSRWGIGTGKAHCATAHTSRRSLQCAR